MRNLLIVVDMVNGFVNEGALADKNINRIVPAIIEKIEQAKRNGDMIIAFRDSHKLNDVEFKTYPPHCLRGSYESKLIDELKPYEKDMIIIEKNTTNGYNTMKMKEILKRYNFGQIELTGCCTDICVSALAESLIKHNAKTNNSTPIIIDEKCVDTFSGEGHEADKVNKETLERLMSIGVEVVKKEDENFKPIKVRKITKGKFVNMFEVTFKNPNGQIKYEVVTRKNLPECVSPKLKTDAVLALPYSYVNGSTIVYLIKEFRYPVGDYIYELPAGLVENNEDGKTAVIRELEEEIGAKVKSIIQTEKSSYTSAGLTDESIECYEAEVEVDEKQHLESTETIEVVPTKLEDVEKLLETKKFGTQAQLQLRSFLRKKRIEELERKLSEFEREDV